MKNTAAPPPTRPAAGLCLPAQVRAVISADHLMIDLAGGMEIELFLIGIRPAETILQFHDDGKTTIMLTRSARRSRDRVAKIISNKTTVVYIPQPAYDHSWIRNLRPQSRHAGVVYLGDSGTLNQRIAADGISATDPECDYLSPSWTCRENGEPRPTPRPV